jgi:hypothetical protein
MGMTIEQANAQVPPPVVIDHPHVRRPDQQYDAPPVRPLAEIDVARPTMSGDVPADLSAGLFSPTAVRRSNEPVTIFSWTPTNLRHQPLYFEDAALERYGQRVHPPGQPFLSATRFYGTFAVMPVKLLIDPPHATRAPHWPGSLAPCCR